MFDPSLLEAYLKTTYEVFSGEKIIKLRINEYNPEIDFLLEKSGSKSWAFITAYNPFSQKLSEAENKFRQDQLINEINVLNHKTFPGVGRPDNDFWKPEISVFVLDISVKTIDYLAVKYEQNSVVTGKKSQAPTLKTY